MSEVAKFSIVMAVRNGADYLPRALDSLLTQSYRKWELVVQDGGSDDGTLDILERVGDDRVLVDSGKDGGVYDAWNKALDRVTGKWIMFLGADDMLVDEHVLARAVRPLDTLDGTVLFAQAGLYLGRQGQVRDTVARSRAEVFRFFISGMPLLPPAVFFRKSLFREDRFDPSYKIAGDFAFVAGRLTPGNMALLDFVSTYMEIGGLSSSVKNRPLLDAERTRVLADIVKPRAADLVQFCIDTYSDTGSPVVHETR